MTAARLFGKSLLKQGAMVDTAIHLEGKYVLVYFSAHWCPPCRGFTPSLAEFYTNLQEAGSVPFEIIFASSDRNHKSFNEYYSTMPWAALPFGERMLKDALSAQFKVRGIPALIVLNPQGELITSNGRELVCSDPTGKDFPWLPKSVYEILEDGNDLISTKGNTVAPSSVQETYFGIFFSHRASTFTPTLIAMYQKLKQQQKSFEVIFVSLDSTEEEFNEYFAQMPWLSIGFQDKRTSDLKRLFDINITPQLILVDEYGRVVTKQGIIFVENDPAAMDFPWSVTPLQDIAHCNPVINQEPCMIGLLAEGKENSFSLELLKGFAEANAEAASAHKETKIHFFYSIGTRSPAMRSIAKEVGLGGKPALVFLNIPAGGYFVSDIESEYLSDILAAFQSGKLNWTSFSSFGPLKRFFHLATRSMCSYLFIGIVLCLFSFRYILTASFMALFGFVWCFLVLAIFFAIGTRISL